MPLEEIEKRIKIAASQGTKQFSSLDLLYDLNQALPAGVYLTNFAYEENSQVVLRGQAKELNLVFALVAQLEKSPVFKGFEIKISYATKRKVSSGEIVSFEIAISRK